MSVDIPLLPRLNEMTVGLNDTERSGEETLAVKVTLPLNTPILFRVILEVPGEPAWSDRDVVLAIKLKSPAAAALIVELAFGLPKPVG